MPNLRLCQMGTPVLGVDRLVNLKRWINHIDYRLGDKTETKFDEDSVTLEHVIETIDKNMLLRCSESVS